MKIPLNLLKEYVKLPKSVGALGEKLSLVGHMLNTISKVNGETVMDLELRGNRADCYSILGIAREVAAIFDTTISLPPLRSDLKKVFQLEDCQIEIKSEFVKRVMAVIIKDVKIIPSPDWLKNKLESCDIPSINNIVDLTNFVMVETGQPMHSFDLDLVKPKITIRLAKNGEKIITFEGTTITTTKEDLAWTKGDHLLSVAGVIGAKDFSILPTTKNILVEAASYDRVNIRRTCRHHNLLTEAGLRHEKELDPNLVEQAIYRLLYLIKENRWGSIEPFAFDYYPTPRKEAVINLPYENLEKLSGFKILAKTVKEIFRRLNIRIKKENKASLTLICPTYRTDLIEEADLIEEVLRIYGYDKIPEKILSLEIPPFTTPKSITQEDQAKQILVGFGLDEVINSSFISEKYQAFNISLENNQFEPVTITNPPSPDFQTMRLSLLPNLVEITKKVIDNQGKKALFFEIGRVYFKERSSYREKRKLGISFWRKNKTKENFLMFKGYLEAFFKALNFPKITFKQNEEKIFSHFAFDIFMNDKKIATGGQFDWDIFFAEINLDSTVGLENQLKVALWPKFPPFIEDLSFIVPAKTLVGEMIDQIKIISKLIASVESIDSYKDTRTFRITYQSSSRTLTDKAIKKIRKRIIEKIEKRFHAKLKA